MLLMDRYNAGVLDNPQHDGFCATRPSGDKILTFETLRDMFSSILGHFFDIH